MKLPQSFLDLHAAGRFDYWGGKPYHDMDDAERAGLLKERRNEVLWLRGIEWDVPPEGVAELDWARTEVPRLMAGVASLSVPLLAEVGVGANWDQAH